MIIKKLRIKNSWSQEQLAHFSGLSIRTIQRAERGDPINLESLKSIAAVFETSVEEIQQESIMKAETHSVRLTDEEADAIEYVKNLKEFYIHLSAFLVIIPFLTFINWFTSPSYYWVFWVIGAWSVGVILHAVVIFNWIHFFDANWEKKQIEKKLGRKL